MKATGFFCYWYKSISLQSKMCLGNVSQCFRINNMKNAGLKEVVKYFSVDFNLIDTNDVLDIHKNFMKRI